MLSEWDLNEMMKAAGVPATARHVLRTIRMRLAMGEAFPSYKTIAEDVGISRRAAINTVGDCVKNEWLVVQKRSIAPGHNATNVYGLTPRQNSWCSSGSEHVEDRATQAGVVNHDHHCSEPRSPGVGNEVHQGSELGSPKQGKNEEDNEEGRQKHTPANVGEAAASAAPVSVFNVDDSAEAAALAIGERIPDYARAFCQASRIDDVEGLWEAFEGYAARERYRFAGAAWRKPAAEQLFGKFVRIGLAQTPGAVEEAA